jgi:hypothetical protein
LSELVSTSGQEAAAHDAKGLSEGGSNGEFPVEPAPQ